MLFNRPSQHPGAVPWADIRMVWGHWIRQRHKDMWDYTHCACVWLLSCFQGTQKMSSRPSACQWWKFFFYSFIQVSLLVGLHSSFFLWPHSHFPVWWHSTFLLVTVSGLFLLSYFNSNQTKEFWLLLQVCHGVTPSWILFRVVHIEEYNMKFSHWVF